MLTRAVIALVSLVVAFAVLGANLPVLTRPAPGRDMFDANCAACHGTDAKGNGPAAAALKTPPPDLTKLSAKAGGEFPEAEVYGAIQGDIGLAAHGSKNMPVWGATLDPPVRAANLVSYIKSLQGM